MTDDTGLFYVTSDAFTGLVSPAIDGPMTEDECDIEYVRAVIDQVGNVCQRDMRAIHRLERKGLVKVIIQVTPLGEQKVREMS